MIEPILAIITCTACVVIAVTSTASARLFRKHIGVDHHFDLFELWWASERGGRYRRAQAKLDEIVWTGWDRLEAEEAQRIRAYVEGQGPNPFWDHAQHQAPGSHTVILPKKEN